MPPQESRYCVVSEIPEADFTLCTRTTIRFAFPCPLVVMFGMKIVDELAVVVAGDNGKDAEQ